MLFTAPLFLLLFLSLPVLVWLGWPSRGPGRRRELVSLSLRLLIAALIILSLAGLEIKRPADRLSVVFLVDASDSMTIPATVETSSGPVTVTPRQLALAYVREALTHMKASDTAGVILFGGDAAVERPLSNDPALEAFTSKITSIQTDLAEAIRLGLALLPVDTARRMVILSDGLETTGDAYEAAKLAAASGVEIRIIPFAVTDGAEAILTTVSAPSQLRAGEQFALEVTIESALAQSVGVRVLAGEAVAYEGTLKLNKGVNNVTLPLTAGEPGFASYRVQITPVNGGDVFYQNNELAAFSQIQGPPKVLVVKNPAPRDGVNESREIVAALAASNILADVVDPTGLPSELPALSEYASVILVDVPARDLAPRQMTALQTYVRDLGGGLVAVGGPSAYGVGGYFRTPLEDTLPVEMQIKDQKRRPRLTMVFIIDKSGSMSETSGGPTKVDLAKEAVVRSIQLLSPMDKVGVIAFDDTARWVVPITTLDDPDAVINAVGSIRADGGTDIYGGVKAAADVLPGDDSQVKHVILLTDGGADPTGIADMIKKLNTDYGVTLSSVGVGRDAAPFLPELAAAGGGQYHFTADPATIATIFTEETVLATRAYIIEEEFFPQRVSPSPILSGIDSVPALLGYVGTTAKAAAQTILISAQEDPILAAWQYGLGKSVAWTSDATGRWAQRWVTWDNYSRFWAQVVRYTISDNARSTANVRVTHDGEQAAITVDAKSDAGAYLNGLTMTVNVVGPDGATQAVTLQQIGPGQYAGAFTPDTEGAYLIRVAGNDPAQPAGGEAAIAQTAGWVLSYSPEYRSLQAQPNFLLQLAALTGGGGVKESADIFAHNLTAPAQATQLVWPLLLTLAALLLPLDIAVRRLVVTRLDVQRGWQKTSAAVRDWLSLRPPPAAAVPSQRVEQLSSLFKAKERAGGESTKDTTLAPPARAGEEHEETLMPPIVTASPIAMEKKEAPPAVAAPPKPPTTASTSAALLAAKRKKTGEKKD